MTGPNLYDVLDVDPGASEDEIREAWRSATADLTPADRRFRVYSQAAEVLLDPERRAAYDAQLAAEADAGDAGPATEESRTTAVAPAAPTATAGPAERREGGVAAALTAARGRLRRDRSSRTSAAATTTAGSGRRTAPTWALGLVAVLTVLSLALMVTLLRQPSQAGVEDAAGEARSAAERAIVPVLSYDHETLAEDQEAAHDYLTESYLTEYDRFFEGVITPNAERTEAVVDVELVSSAVVRASEDRAEILLFVNRPTTNAENQEPVVFKDQVRVQMQRVDDEWLVDCLLTEPEGSCGG